MQGGTQEKAAMSGKAQAADKGSRNPIIEVAAIANKRVATIKAELAMRGFEVHDTDAGGWLVARWNLSKHCPGIEDLEAFLGRVGGAA